MPYQLISDDHMRERLERGEARRVDGTVVEYDGVRWVRNGEVWVLDEPGRGGGRRRSPRVPPTGRAQAAGASVEPAGTADTGDTGDTGDRADAEAAPASKWSVGWRRPVFLTSAGFVVTLLLLAMAALHQAGQDTGTPRAGEGPPARSALPSDPALPGSGDSPQDPSGDATSPPYDAGTDSGFADGVDDGANDGAADGAEPDPFTATGAPPDEFPPEVELPPRRLIGDNQPANFLARPQDPGTALAAVERRIDQAAARGQLSPGGRILLSTQVRKLARTLEADSPGRLGRVAERRLAAGIGGLRTTVAGLALFRRIATEAAESIRTAVDQFERTLR